MVTMNGQITLMIVCGGIHVFNNNDNVFIQLVLKFILDFTFLNFSIIVFLMSFS